MFQTLLRARSRMPGLLAPALLLCACSQKPAGAEKPWMSLSSDAGAAAGASGPAAGSGGQRALPPARGDSREPFSSELAYSSARKVKTLLTGLAVTDEEVSKLEADGQVGLKQLIHGYVNDAATQEAFRDKMLVFFRNAFQQAGFLPAEDFKFQLLQNGGFDFAGGARSVGDDAYPRLVQSIEDSFALTAWALVQEGRPFSEVLTTQRFMLTTALKTLYLQIDAPNDRATGRNAPQPLAWKVDYSGKAIPLSESLDPNSPNYLRFDDQLPVTPVNRGNNMRQICQGGMAVDAMGVAITEGTFSGQSRLFQRLLGYTPRYPNNGTTLCYEHASRPYFTAQDLSDWQWVSVRPLQNGETQPRAYDLPALRTLKELPLRLPRIGFYTTPAFLAMWNSNDSNRHRVTANQTWLVAFNGSFSSADVIVPLSTEGLDGEHAVDGSECYGCHKGLDPLRAFWGNQFDYNDRNDFPTRGTMMTAANPRPSKQGGVLAFMDVNAEGASMLDLGALLASTTDGEDQPLNAFALALAQKLCFYANSAPCGADDAELRRVVKVFQDKNLDFRVLIEELFSSPLITGERATASFDKAGVPLSIARRDHLCGALSQRFAKPDLCAQNVPVPSSQQQATARIASSIPADAFSRGSELPITPSSPTMFQRSAVEMLCENLSVQLVDAMNGGVLSSSDVPAAITRLVESVMNYPPSHPQHAAAAQILKAHHDQARMQKGTSAAQALRSTFVLACEAPTSAGIGL